MSLLDGIIGNASQVDAVSVQKEFQAFLALDEKVDCAYKLIRDMFIFTNKRLILVDKQGLTGNKVEYHSIPYSKITQFSVETGGHFDLDAELKIWVTGMGAVPIEKKFNKQLSIYEVERELAEHVLN